MRAVLLLVACLVSTPSFSQIQRMPRDVDSLEASSSTIYLQGSLLGGNHYVQNGRTYSAGGSYGKLRMALMSVPEAYELAGVGSRIVTHGRLLSIAGAVIGSSTFFVHGERWELGLSIGGFAVAVLGGAIQMKGRNRIHRAVWIFNEAQQQGRPESD